MIHKKSMALFLVALVAGVYLIAPVAAVDSGTISGRFKTGNTPPTVTFPYNVPGTADPTPDGVTELGYIYVQVHDVDGNGDIVKVEASLHNMQDSSIEIDYAQATGGWSVVDANTISVVFTSLHFNYYTPPGQYAITATATDVSGSTGTLTSNAITYNSAIGLTIDGPIALDFGTLTYGQQSATKTSTIHNSANTNLYVAASAPDWVSSAGGSSISAETLYIHGAPLANGGTVEMLGVANSGGSGASQLDVSFFEKVPAQSSGFTLLGTYTTTITLTAHN